jgi:hypothetical protein
VYVCVQYIYIYICLYVWFGNWDNNHMFEVYLRDQKKSEVNKQ